MAIVVVPTALRTRCTKPVLRISQHAAQDAADGRRSDMEAASGGVGAQRQLHLPIDDNYTSPSSAPPEGTG
jgi:hypothetical protein